VTKTKLRIFPAIPRNPDSAKYADELLRIARFSDLHGFAGILLFTGNDTLVEPWSMAQHILAHTANSSPLIAVNPIYMHPFTVAKLVSSFALIYQRKVYLNMVTGTALRDLEGLGDRHSHSSRYLRLSEFIYVVRELLATSRPVTFKGKFYRIDNLQLRPGLPAALMPEFLVAGQSVEAHRVARKMGCLMMQMLPPNLEEGIGAPGVNFGIFTREEREEARRAAQGFFRDSVESRLLLEYSMQNTDSVWKQKLNEAAQSGELHDNGYWLKPFVTYQSDCPYLVGSYADIGAHLRRFAEKDVRTIILDVVADEQELQHICEALAYSGVF
jgi:alkanesulfonate monooxygenase